MSEQQQPPQQAPPQQQQPPPPQQQQQERASHPSSGGRGGRQQHHRGGHPQQQHQGGGRGRGHLYNPNQQQRSPPPQHHQQHPKPISLNPSSGIPYGHVPAYLPGSASLVEQLDHRVLIILRDGKHVIGVLSSFDQFSNMILQDAVERRFYTSTKAVQAKQESPTTYYSDIPLGVYVIRGDSMVLLGTINDSMNAGKLQEVSLEELEKLEREETAATNAATNTPDDDKSKKLGGPLTWDFDTDLIA